MIFISKNFMRFISKYAKVQPYQPESAKKQLFFDELLLPNIKKRDTSKKS